MTTNQYPMPTPPLPRRLAWLPIPLFLLAITALWIADARTSFESRGLLLAMHILFTGVASLCIAYRAAGGFLSTAQPALLMFGSGAVLWCGATLAASVQVNDNCNIPTTIHNLGMLGAGLCYLGGLVWQGHLRRPVVWVAAGYASALAAVALLVWAVVAGWTPAFFVQGQGGTPLRQVVLVAAITIYAGTAGLMLLSHSREPSVFLYWFGLGLALLAIGLAGVMLQAVHGCLLGWTGRAAQMLGGAYLLIAALMADRETDTRRLSLTAVERAWHEDFLPGLRRHSLTWWTVRYGLAAVAVAATFGLRIAVDAWGGPPLPPYSLLYPAIMCVAVLGGLGPGLLATALAVLAVHIWIQIPADASGAGSIANRLDLSVFGGMGVLMSMMAFLYRCHRVKAAAYDRAAALRTSSERLAAFAKATFEGISESENGHVVDCNEQLARLCGCTVAELKGASIADFIAPEDRERVLSHIRQNRESVIEHAMIRKDGTRIVVETHGRPVTPGSTRRYTVVRDVTYRNQAEEAVREQQRQLALALIAGKLVSWTIDLAGDKVEPTPQLLDLFGLDPNADIVSRADWRALVHEEDRPMILQSVEAAKAGREHHIEYRIHHPDGTIHWHESHGIPLADATGRYVRLVGYVRDITERKQAEEALRELNEELTRFNKVAVGREMRMIELKKEINAQCAASGHPPRYIVHEGMEIRQEALVNG